MEGRYSTAYRRSKTISVLARYFPGFHFAGTVSVLRPKTAWRNAFRFHTYLACFGIIKYWRHQAEKDTSYVLVACATCCGELWLGWAVGGVGRRVLQNTYLVEWISNGGFFLRERMTSTGLP